MNDVFAATVAAVVPVLWLVAVVAVHENQRRAFPLVWPMDQQLASALQAIRSVTGEAPPEVISAARRALEDAKLHQPESRSVLDRFHTRFMIVAVVLLGVEALSLLWLFGWRDSPVFTGWICFGGTIIGFLSVLQLPLSAVRHEALDSVRQRVERMQEVGSFVARHSGRDNDAS